MIAKRDQFRARFNSCSQDSLTNVRRFLLARQASSNLQVKRPNWLIVATAENWPSR